MNIFFRFSPWILQNLIWIPTRLILQLFCHLKIEGSKHLKDLPKGVVFSSNHSSELDAVLIPASLPMFSRHLPMFYTSRERAFYKRSSWRQNLYGGFMFKLWGAHSLQSGHRDYDKSLATHIKILKQGGSICIFPEGKRTLDGKIHPENAHGGVIYLTEVTKKPIVPVKLSGHYNMTLSDLFFRKRAIRVVFGEPIKGKHYTNIASDEKKDIYYRNLAKEVMGTVMKL